MDTPVIPVKPPKLDHKYVCDQFKNHKRTMLDIAQELGVTYQAVYRVLNKNGLSRKDGGKAAQVAERENKKSATEASDESAAGSAATKSGCTKEQWEFLRSLDEDYKNTPLAAFNTFKNNFQNLYPNVEFKLNIWDWWTLWDQSGKWEQRKRGCGVMHVMAQIDKALPFTKENARIVPFGQLLKETRAAKPSKKNDPPK